MRTPAQFSRRDSGYYDVRFADPSGQGIEVDPDLRIEFRDSTGTLRFIATTTSTPPIQMGTDTMGPFYFVVGLDLTNWAYGAVRAESFATVNGTPFSRYPLIEEPAFTVVADQIPLQLQRDEVLFALLKGTKQDILTVVIDPVTGYRADAERIKITILDNKDVEVGTYEYPTSPEIQKRDYGVFSFEFDSEVFSAPEYLANVTIDVASGLSFVRNKVVRVVPGTYFKIGAIFRNQIDKANKLLHHRLQFGYTDAQLITWLDLGTYLINSIPPYTAFSVASFPFAIYGKILIDAATLAALESQGLFAIDTDFDYSLGGTALVIDHFTKISGFVENLAAKFNENLKQFKQMFRSKGGALVQTQYGYGFGRFLSVVPPGFFSRFGLQVGPGVGNIVSTGVFP